MSELKRIPVILDADTGVDDTMALLLAAQHPMLDVLAIFLFSIFGVQMEERERISDAIEAKRDRITVLEVQCGQTRDQIATQSNDVNIRQEAVRMGLISSKGVRVNYLQAPTDAVITLTGTSGITALASIWGN